MTARTSEAIKARIEAVAYEDPFGFHREVLINALSFEDARDAGFLVDGATPEQWAEGSEPLVDAARNYLTFAVGKMLDHRGISANRSVDKLTEYAWLMGRDDIVAAMGAAGYENYGAPKVKAFADGLGWTDVWKLAAGSRLGDLERMADGEPCHPGCERGCGQ